MYTKIQRFDRHGDLRKLGYLRPLSVDIAGCARLDGLRPTSPVSGDRYSSSRGHRQTQLSTEAGSHPVGSVAWNTGEMRACFSGGMGFYWWKQREHLRPWPVLDPSYTLRIEVPPHLSAWLALYCCRFIKASVKRAVAGGSDISWVRLRRKTSARVYVCVRVCVCVSLIGIDRANRLTKKTSPQK